MTDTATTAPFTGRTAWARNLEEPLRQFLRTETGGAAILLAASVAALIWVNIDAGSYERVWNTTLSVRLGVETPGLHPDHHEPGPHEKEPRP